jgi:hypothetical protein
METQLKVFKHQYQPGWFVADDTGVPADSGSPPLLPCGAASHAVVNLGCQFVNPAFAL